MSLINLKNIRVSYNGKIDVLKNLSMDVEKGKLISLLGPSGCGKTTTLRVITGFIEPKDGQFIFDGTDYTNMPVYKRNFGVVFQSYALFPHLTVFDNVAFGLKMRKMNKEDLRKDVLDILTVVDLKGFENRYPQELSGGQRQRVALARALVIKPKLLLLDEPLSNLDAKLRINMRVEIKKLQQKLGITTIFVTHDQEECFSISDKVAIMNNGIIEQYDSPENIYAHPASEFVARFVGFENFISLKQTDGKLYKSADGSKFKSDHSLKNKTGNIVGTIRPDDIQLLPDSGAEDLNTINGKIDIRTYLGKHYQYSVSTDLGNFIVNGSKEEKYVQGDKVSLYLPSNKIILV